MCVSMAAALATLSKEELQKVVVICDRADPLPAVLFALPCREADIASGQFRAEAGRRLEEEQRQEAKKQEEQRQEEQSPHALMQAEAGGAAPTSTPVPAPDPPPAPTPPPPPLPHSTAIQQLPIYPESIHKHSLRCRAMGLRIRGHVQHTLRGIWQERGGGGGPMQTGTQEHSGT